jgi:SAM-dependent methyltransferase
MEFICNICGGTNRPAKPMDRESASCASCGSNVRLRSLMYVLSMELFGTQVPVPDFPSVKSLRGLGMTDFSQYASRLAEKFDYRNTFYDREPRFDLSNPPREELGKYDFLISSEVFEHVLPPAESALRNAFDLLKPNGVLMLSVPYSVEPSMKEHYPDLHEFGFAQVGDEIVLVNRTRSGEMQVFEKPVFHQSGAGEALEMREFNESDLKRMLAAAGFREVKIYAENYAPFGIVQPESWSLPIAARKGHFALPGDSTREVMREVMEQWRDQRRNIHEQARRLDRSLWFRIGRKLGFL